MFYLMLFPLLLLFLFFLSFFVCTLHSLTLCSICSRFECMFVWFISLSTCKFSAESELGTRSLSLKWRKKQKLTKIQQKTKQKKIKQDKCNERERNSNKNRFNVEAARWVVLKAFPVEWQRAKTEKKIYNFQDYIECVQTTIYRCTNFLFERMLRMVFLFLSLYSFVFYFILSIRIYDYVISYAEI